MRFLYFLFLSSLHTHTSSELRTSQNLLFHGIYLPQRTSELAYVRESAIPQDFDTMGARRHGTCIGSQRHGSRYLNNIASTNINTNRPATSRKVTTKSADALAHCPAAEATTLSSNTGTRRPRKSVPNRPMLAPKNMHCHHARTGEAPWFGRG